jgi:hypothetical protein
MRPRKPLAGTSACPARVELLDAKLKDPTLDTGGIIVEQNQSLILDARAHTLRVLM